MTDAQKPLAWMTHHDEPMLFPTEKEAAAYCDDDEKPIPLYAHPADDEALQVAQARVKVLEEALQAIVDLDDGDSPDLWNFADEFDAAGAALAGQAEPAPRLTDDEITAISKASEFSPGMCNTYEFARAIEARVRGGT